MENYHPLLSSKETADLLEQAQAGDPDAVDQLVRCNQRLVYSIAIRYHESGFGGDQELDDLVQWGNFGLFRAIQKWDRSRGFAFSTYAVGWIDGTIRRHARMRGNPLGMSDRDGIKLSHIRRARSELLQALGREPSVEDVADKTGLPCEYVRHWLPALDHLRRLDGPALTGLEEGETLLYEVLPDPGQEPDTRELIGEVTEMLSALNTIEREIITRHYLSDPPRSFPQIAHDLGIRQWVVEKIEGHALVKLRNIARMDLNLRG